MPVYSFNYKAKQDLNKILEPHHQLATMFDGVSCSKKSFPMSLPEVQSDEPVRDPGLGRGRALRVGRQPFVVLNDFRLSRRRRNVSVYKVVVRRLVDRRSG